MLSNKTLLLVLAACFLGASAHAEDCPFNRLQCHSTISSDLSLTSPGDQLNFVYESRGEDLRPLVRALLPTSVPDSLVRAYHCIEVRFNLPQSACTFDDESPESFSCNHELTGDNALEFAVRARLSCYENEADHFTGRASAATLATESLTIRNNGYFRVLGSLALVGGDGAINFTSEDYFGFYWDYDGFRQDPECKVDGAPIVVSP